MRVCAISANLGRYDRPVAWVEQRLPAGVTLDVHRFTDENFPPRPLAMTARLQCGIPKWWGWEMLPGYDVYVWLDASVVPTPDGIAWFLDRLSDHDIAVFAHPDRKTVSEEYAFMVTRMARPGERYLNSRYRGEWLTEQFEYIQWRGGAQSPLFATTAFAYRPTVPVLGVLKDTWSAKARWLLHDQLMFAYAMTVFQPDAVVLPENYLKCPALTFTRKRR